jgi:hypothetical protein
MQTSWFGWTKKSEGMITASLHSGGGKLKGEDWQYVHPIYDSSTYDIF